MNYTQNSDDTQLQLLLNDKYLMIPSMLESFNNTSTTIETTKSQREIFRFNGTLDLNEADKICSECGSVMHINNHRDLTLRHLCFGGNLSCVNFDRIQYYCSHCHCSSMQTVPFKAEHHFMTVELEQYTNDLLTYGTYTLKQVAGITGLGKNVVKDIDSKRLRDAYTIDGRTLIKPEQTAKYLGIDEFKLHDGYKYATHIIDMETGHILWIAHGKKKQVVYDFIQHVGVEWMDNVEAIACDMNSDFEEAFEEKYPHIQPVFDYFHIVKNFNDKVIGNVRKDEQKRLMDEGDIEAAKSLKRTRYILTSSRKTLARKDQEAEDEKVLSKGSDLFNTKDVKRKKGYVEKYENLLKENELLFTIDIIKEKLTDAYISSNEDVMTKKISEIMDMCKATNNKHLLWFRRLLDNHFEGIIAHAAYKISAGKIEGINNKIKTIRRQGYGYPDDEYFFLKLFDLSRMKYVRNVKSHKICD